MQKTIGACLILLSSAAIGFQKSRVEEKKLQEMKSLLQMIYLLKSNIQTRGLILADAFEETAEKLSNPYADFLKTAASKLRQKQGLSSADIFSECRCKLQDSLLFGSGEMELLIQLGKYLENTDKIYIMNQLDEYAKEMTYSIDHFRDELAQRKKLFQKLGIWGGFLLVILIW